MRLIAASPSSLEEKIDRGEFREDLFYRLQGLVLTLPRLDDRTDKRARIRHVFAQETAHTPSLSPSEEVIDTEAAPAVSCANTCPISARLSVRSSRPRRRSTN